MRNLKAFFEGKKILVTGHTGFKGSWLVFWLKQWGAEVFAIALPPSKEQGILFNALKIKHNIHSIYQDITELSAVKQIVESVDPEIVFHLAAQPIVRASYDDPVGTYQDNVVGTLNILEAIRKNAPSIRAAIFITTDKCYKDKGSILYTEEDELGGYDPYSSSKACCELLIESYRKSFFQSKKIAICSARAGNILGGGDFGQSRLVPDIIRTLRVEQDLILRSPNATRPWQYVLDVLYGYLLLAYKAYNDPLKYSQAYNFANLSIGKITVLDLAQAILNKISSRTNITIQEELFHETTYLQISVEKAQKELLWQPKLNFTQIIEHVCAWYSAYLHEQDLYELSEQFINQYSELELTTGNENIK